MEVLTCSIESMGLILFALLGLYGWFYLRNSRSKLQRVRQFIPQDEPDRIRYLPPEVIDELPSSLFYKADAGIREMQWACGACFILGFAGTATVWIWRLI